MAAQNKEALRRVMAARTGMVLDEPFWGQLSSRLKLREDPSCPTAWTDGTTLGYSPRYVLSLQHKRVVALMAHAVMHCALGHPWRRNGREMKRFNIAADLAINSELRKAGFTLPDGALFPEQYSLPEGKSVEWYFDRLPKAEPKADPQRGEDEEQAGGSGQQPGQGSAGEDEQEQEPEEQQDGQDGQDDEAEQDEQDEQDEDEQGDGDAQEQGEDDEQDEDKDGQDDGPPRPEEFGEVRDAPTASEDDQQKPQGEEGWKQAVLNAAATAAAQGKMPGGLERLVAAAKRSKVDWVAVTLRFAQEAARNDYSWRRPNPRYVAHGTYLPRLDSHEVGVMAIMIDTSGSIDGVLLEQFQGVVNAIVDDVKPRQVRVGYIDAALHRVDDFDRGEPVKFKPVGGGGTDFRPAFTAIESWEEQPVCVIYLTDLYGCFPERDPGVPTLWVIPQEKGSAPFGEVISAAA